MSNLDQQVLLYSAQPDSNLLNSFRSPSWLHWQMKQLRCPLWLSVDNSSQRSATNPSMSQFSDVFGGDKEFAAFHTALAAIAGSAEVEQRQKVGIGLSLRGRKGRVQDPLAKLFRQVAHVDHLKRHTRETVSNEQLEQLWQLLQSHSTVQLDTEQLCITYPKFLECGKGASATIGPHFDAYFRPLLFYGLHRYPPQDAVSIDQIFTLIMQGSANERHRLSLMPYGSTCNGMLSEENLESWLHERALALEHLSQMSPIFRPTYVIYAATKFFFLLDHTRTRKVGCGCSSTNQSQLVLGRSRFSTCSRPWPSPI